MLLQAFAIIGLLFSTASSQSTYLLFLSKYIRPGFEIDATISIFSVANPISVAWNLHSTDNAFSSTGNAVVNPGDTSTLVFGSVPLGYQGSTNFNLLINGTDTLLGTELFTNMTDDFVFASKALSIYIQTDKAIYQPGQTIQFRAICLSPSLRPYTGNVTYQVLDPRDNIVLLENDIALSHGVAEGSFPLNKDSMTGDWQIQYIVEKYVEKLPVTVKLYKLPKFEVTISAPSYIHSGSHGLTINVSATYTYGKPVDGSASLKLSSTNYVYRPIYGYTQPSIQQKKSDFDGSWTIFVPISEIKSRFNWIGSSDLTIFAEANVTEGLTGTKFESSKSIDAKSSNIKVEILYKLLTIKPGLSYSAFIRVTAQDGSALSDIERAANDLIVDITYTYPKGHQFPEDVTTPPPYLRPTRQEKRVLAIPANGLIRLDITTPNDDFRNVRFEVFTNQTILYHTNQWTATRADSPSNSYIQITTNDSSVMPGGRVAVTVATTEAISNFEVMLLARGKIVDNFQISAIPGPARNLHDFFFNVAYSMMPSVYVLASYVRSDGEVVADYTEITVTVELENEVSISSSSRNVDAGTNLSITVQTSSADAYVGLRAIDKSVLLLKSGNDITNDRVVRDLNRYSVEDNHVFDDFFWWWWYPRPSGAKDSAAVFQKAGMIVLTDGLIYKSPINDDYIYPYLLRKEIAIESFSDIVRSPSASLPTVTPRSFFPETWLWKDLTSGTNGSASFHTQAPDTITSWVLSAFAVSDQFGLGIADTYNITVFRNFFVSLNLPLKITRGEIVIIQANIFNYFDRNLEVQVTLSDSVNFEFLVVGDDATTAGRSRLIEVPANSAVAVYFPVLMNTLGEIPITVTAIAEIAQDAVIRRVYVRPEGIPQCYSASDLIIRDSRSNSAFQGELEVKIPDGIVEGSQTVRLYVYGQILGNTLRNLGSLLRTPSGCGEQNMLGFAPDVFITLFLKTAGLLDPETQKKAYQHFYDGYSNELRYKHADGSYSAFGDRNGASGSTWLTAFVAKCFMFARILRPELVQASIINEAVQFLIEQQNLKTGVFNEPGKVSHRAMQGGVNSPLTMTAYVLVALSETNFTVGNLEVEDAVIKARNYLENNLDSIQQNSFALAIVTYALHLSGSNRANEALAALNNLATVAGSEKYWQSTVTDASEYNQRWRPPYYNPPSNEIEITAYALLIYSYRNDINSALPIIKWLTSKQNSFGGYSSTQDTVIAVQALASVAELMVGNEQDLSITITHSSDAQFSHTYEIDNDNVMVFHTIEVPPVSGNVEIQSTGVGVGVVQLSVCYNLPSEPFDDESFECSLRVDDKSLSKADIRFCCSLKPDDQKPTGMFLFSVELPNGFTVDLDNTKTLNSEAQLVELLEGKVAIYYDSLDVDTSLCANAELTRYADVAAVKPSYAEASEYYVQERRVSRTYALSKSADAGVCDVCGEKCVGCPAAFLSWGNWSPCFEFCEPQISTREKRCMDPSLGEEVNIVRCGLQQVPTEAKSCPTYGFPCPDISEGLWYNLPSTFLRLSNGRPHRYNCNMFRHKPPGPERGIPGSIFSQRLKKLMCDFLDFEIGDDGFSFSLLMKLNDFDLTSNISFVVVSIGDGIVKPKIKLEKTRLPHMRLTVYANGSHFYRVKKIPIEPFINTWKHLTVTWSPLHKPRVYINGRKVGSSSKPKKLSAGNELHFYRNEGMSVGFGITMQIEYKSRTENIGENFLNGVLSTFLYWKKELSRSDVKNLFSFFDGYVNSGDSEPLLSLPFIRLHIQDDNIRCFNAPFVLSELYGENQTSTSFGCGD